MSESQNDTTEDVGPGRLLTCSDRTRDSHLPSPIKILGMNSHNDFISFLAVAQYYEIDFVSLGWEQGRGRLGSGGTSEIWQSSLDKGKDFAFKRMRSAITDSDDQENGFNALVSEVSILSHPSIRHHQNIVNLEGISWENHPKSQKVWPVLVLEKARLGDLRSFMDSEEGRLTTMRDRLELCTDVASAIIALHSNYMSHGDIKPENVLLFMNGTEEWYAKLADFGYAGWAINNKEDVLIKPPRSRPWDPPEYHHRGFTVLGARKLDIYSFGMLCLWVLFFDRSIVGVSVPTEVKLTWSWPFHDLKLLDKMKREDILGDFAIELVRSVEVLPANQRGNLERFFRSALARDPAERTMKLEELASLLGHDWQPGPSALDAEQMEIDYSSVYFKISKSFYPLMRTHIRVRNNIFKCLGDQAQGGLSEHHRRNAAFQIAFCFETGFGTPSNGALVQNWLERAHRCVQDLDEAVKFAKGTMKGGPFRNGILQLLANDGLLGETISIIGCKDNELAIVAAEYKREIRDIELALGKHNLCVLELKLDEVYILEAAGKLKEAEALRIDLLQALKKHPDPFQKPELDYSLGLVVSICPWKALESARWRFFEGSREPPLQLKALELEKSSSLISIIACFNHRIPTTFSLLKGLSANYKEQGRYEEAKEILLHLTQTTMERRGESDPRTLDLAERLATLYVYLGQFSEAERIALHISKIQAWLLGENHSYTLSTKALLANLYRDQGRLDEAETILSQVLEAQRKILGQKDWRTYASMSSLAFVYLSQGRYKASEALIHQVVNFYNDSLGPYHLNTLYEMSLHGAVLAKQERWPEVEKITMQVLKGRKEILGPEHTETLTSIQNLASVHAEQGRWREAETEFLHVIESQNRIYDQDSSRTLDTVQNLATIYGRQGRRKQEERLLIKLIETAKGCLGEDHPRSLDLTGHLAWNQLGQSRPKEAERIFIRTMYLGRKVRGEKHPDQLILESGLAEAYRQQKQFKEAEEVILPVVQHIDAALGADHSQTINAKVQLARILNGQRRWRESDSIFLKAMEHRKKVLGGEHYLTLCVLRFYASSLWSQGRWREAVAAFFGSSRGIHTLRGCMRFLRQGFFTVWLGFSLALAVFAIAYVWSDKFTRLG